MGMPALSEDNLGHILEKMYKTKGWDFRRYRKSSIKRCIERRMAFARLPYTDYIDLLDADPIEFHNLFNHITIKVSEFFRDPEVFERIAERVIPASLERLKSEEQDLLRIWSCGCARGEEAYSMAILLLMAGQKAPFIAEADSKEGYTCKIFATDIDETSIDIARKGIYPEDVLRNVHHACRNMFFNPAGNSYQIDPRIRRFMTFGIHDIVSNIHLSHMDIILCRNLLIYFEKDLQEKVFEKFCYSLKKGGFIILGRSEVVPSSCRDRFREVSRREKIYQKI